jgi:hypothetical protein
MQRNIGPDERILRFTLAIACRTAARFIPRGIGLRGLLNVAALAELVSAATGYSPLNQFLGINTYQPEQMRGRRMERAPETERSIPGEPIAPAPLPAGV